MPQPWDPSGDLREFNSTALPLSEFPTFTMANTGPTARLDAITWRGRFCHDKSQHGPALDITFGNQRIARRCAPRRQHPLTQPPAGARHRRQRGRACGPL